MKQEAAEPSSSLCDFCNESKAVLYCRADTARLCLSCDRHVHLANSVSSKHPRSLLCNSCSSAAASILCSSHGPAQVFCSNCDFEAHYHRPGPHERRPVESFSGCPTSAELVPALGLGDGEELLKKKKEKEKEKDVVVVVSGDDENGGLIDETFWEMPQVVRLDDLIVPATAAHSTHGFRATGVPPPPKNRNLACGKQKEEILAQLRELIKSEGQLNSDCEDFDPITEFQFHMPHNGDQTENLHPNFDGDTTFTVMPDFEASELQWNNNDWQEATDPMMFPCDQQIGGLSVVTSFPEGTAGCHTSACPASGNDGAPGHHHIVGESISPLTPKHGLEFLCPDRDTVISRYKEKRKTRRYDKLIRYESRKARADSRVRVKGRFVKANQEPQT